ncbi:Oidioi.mRNA.OKI2018_I69.PAR.g8760.t1.cds [Oikopleura dioica]|uniref:Oidioi.mRNA.OKI2018_I69.PAR.g8760.t1.cds n=1 Tax=Oikopleura dioica TaxID=34765 RepID=A0ABN7RND7_OIKDI|nr:Oidioi.mRNA.OKI2018_I69.PAR.g8760.t1.cds [Oikopleura dioica]
MLTKQISLTNGMVMIISQCFGAFIGAAIVFWIYMDIDINEENASIFATYPRAGVSISQAMVSSIAGTCFMVLSINAVSQSKPHHKPDLSMLPLYTGIAVMTYGICFSLNTGYAINPARDIGPRVLIFLLGFPESFARGNELISCRKCNALWGVIFFILVLIQASMSSFGLNNRLCGAIKTELSNGKCDQKLKFYHGPPDVCDSEDSCKKTTPKIESFYSTLGALEACSWILFTIMFLYNFANIIGVYQRHEAYVMKDPVTLKTTTTTTTPTTSTTQNGAASKRAPPAPPKSASSPPPADFDSDRGSVDFFEFTGN